jgi:hypothetical protein
VVEKSVTNKCQAKNSTPATPCLYKHNREHAFYFNFSSGDHTDVAIGIYIEREARQATYRLNYSGKNYTNNIWPFGGCF